MRVRDILDHPLTHRVCKHTHDYGFYVTIAIFQKEFLVLCGAGFMVLICVSFVQWRLGLEGDKE